MLDYLIKGGTIVDGSGGSPAAGDVGVRDGQIVAVGGVKESARDVNALAYTVGRDVVFADGRLAPHTAAGRRLLAHELAHVLQQTEAPSGAPATVARQAAPLVEPEVVRTCGHAGWAVPARDPGPVTSPWPGHR